MRSDKQEILAYIEELRAQLAEEYDALEIGPDEYAGVRSYLNVVYEFVMTRLN